MYSAYDNISHAYSTVQVTEYLRILTKQGGDTFPASMNFNLVYHYCPHSCKANQIVEMEVTINFIVK
jgi:hypothetical protein